MKVFVAGASGVIGRRLVPMLVESGHEVAGMTRSEGRAEQIEQQGARPVVCDVFDSQRLTSEVKSFAPEAVINELTDLPQALNPRNAERDYAGNDKIRMEGTNNLVNAAREAAVRRLISQSIAFAYDPSPGLKTELDPLWDSAPFPWARSVEALHALEDATIQTPGLDGVVLRYGFLYGPGSAYSVDGHFGKEARKRRLPVVRGADGTFSFIHVDDAAAATVAAHERGDGGEVYNVVDDDPAPAAEWILAFAQAVGAKRPLRLPQWVARLAAGRWGMTLLTQMRAASNEKAKRELGWTPRYRSWREGFATGLQ